MTRSQTVAGY